MLIVVFLFLLGFILITKGADIFINYTVIIGKKTNISELILGATIVSFATTLPELTVSLFASLEGHTTMSLGNAVGSIICNTGLVLGLVGLISPFKVDKSMFFSKSVLLLISVILLIVFGLDGKITKNDGLMLLIMLAIYMYTNYKSVADENKKISKSSRKKENTNVSELICIGIFFVLGLIMMVVGSRLLVDNGVKIAQVIGIPQGVISLTVIALGTSLPELVSSITAIKKKHHAISVGNVLGANILNIVSVIGISAIPNNIPILSQTMKIDFPFMIVLLLVLILPTIKKDRIYRWQGLLMLLIYFTYITTMYLMYIVT
ncbi:calcium/sodium antiporter [Romboutsia lituseburensis]|uniref:Cation:H+ antiporter n=1 Tax=Romboutsia lituseburensis DSM 797 TaxID=1121325 RepID=A0A1G9R713_9FIRM|nr:calcium/sodium antiporter [Romboutsia lituseburensis]CEH35698.1 Ca2+/Na+ antiporter [Romboutsia lituseburensis]SDM19066.1 cation:H+ antiporter [Romboutsia lituseburensis DSM 797]